MHIKIINAKVLFGALAVASFAFAGSAYALGNPVLSSYNVTVGLGQTVTVTSQGDSTGVYVTSNSNPSFANVQANGTTITVTGMQTGSAAVTICYVGTTSNCANLGITVQATPVVQLSLSQTSVTILTGQSATVTASGGSGSYSVTNNSNSGVANTTLSSSGTLTINAVAPGTANITVCDNASHCGTVAVTVNGSTTSTNGSLALSNWNPTVAPGGTASVTISGGTGYYLSYNSNTGVVFASVSGSAITLTGQTAGASTVIICSASNDCATMHVTVSGAPANANQAVSFGTTNPVVTMGQNMNVALSGTGPFTISSNPSPIVTQASVSGNTLTLSGISAGTDSITVCGAAGGCNAIAVSVTSAAQPAATPSPAPAPSPANTNSILSTIQSMQTQLTQLLAQIQSMAAALTKLAASVSASAPASTASVSAGGASSGTHYFTEFLTTGSQDAEVTALQQYLAAKGFYSGPVTGYFGPLTAQAVSAYQAAHGVDAVGYVGPGTRAALNAGE